MDVIKIHEVLNSASYQLNRVLSKAKKLRLFFTGLIILSSVYAFVQLIPDFLKSGYTLNESLIILALLMAVLIVFVLRTSPYTFMPENQMKRFSYALKRQLLNTIFDQKPYDFKLYTDTFFPDDMLSRIGVINKSYSFVTGDDLMVGYVNNYEVKFCEYYVQDWFKPKFSGYVAIVFNVDYHQDAFFSRLDEMQNRDDVMADETETFFSKLFRDNEEIEFIVLKNQNIYFGFKGCKKMLEYLFKHPEKNVDKLESDVRRVEKMLTVIETITGFGGGKEEPETVLTKVAESANC